MDTRIELSSQKNLLIRSWRALNKSRAARLEAGLYIAEGEHMAQEALKEGKASALAFDQGQEARFQPLIDQARAAGIPLYALAPAVFSALTDAKTPQGVLAVCALEAPRHGMMRAPLIVALEDVQDPGNVGTILRTLDALGGCALLLTKGCADPYSPKALRASMGGVFRVPFDYVQTLPEALEALRTDGYRVLAGALDGAPFFARRTDARPTCLLIGNEGAGLSKEALSCATDRVKLPMTGGAESLNAAVACAIMAYDIVRCAGRFL